MSVATEEPVQESKPKAVPQAGPPVSAHPLFVGMPCVFYRSGNRGDAPEAAVCTRVENHEFVSLLLLRDQQDVSAIRHVDDPHFIQSPPARRNGAWDYVQGLAYDLKGADIPPRPDLPPAVQARIVALARDGMTTGQIAVHLNQKGVTSAVIALLLFYAKMRTTHLPD